jgi:hypothetical protein
MTCVFDLLYSNQTATMSQFSRDMKSQILKSNFEQPLAFARCKQRLFVLCKDPSNQNQYEPFATKGNLQVISLDMESTSEKCLAREVNSELLAVNQQFVVCAGQNHIDIIRQEGSASRQIPLPTQIRSLLIEEDRLLVGHREENVPFDPGAISEVNLRTGEISKLCSVPLVTIHALARNHTAIFFHTGQNIYRLENGSTKPELYFSAGEGIRSLSHQDGWLYFVTAEGINRISDSDWSNELVVAFNFGPCRMIDLLADSALILSPAYQSTDSASGKSIDYRPTIWQASLREGKVDSIFSLNTEPPPPADSDFMARLARSRLTPKIIGMSAERKDLIVCSSQGKGTIERVYGVVNVE